MLFIYMARRFHDGLFLSGISMEKKKRRKFHSRIWRNENETRYSLDLTAFTKRYYYESRMSKWSMQLCKSFVVKS